MSKEKRHVGEAVKVATGRKKFTRRRFFKRLAVVLGISGGGVLYAGVIEPKWLEFTRVEIRLKNLPASFDGFRIAQITDTHLGTYVSTRYLSQQIDDLNSRGCDMVVFTGDLTTHSIRKIPVAAEILSRVRAPMGKFAVLGNHDYWTDEKLVRGELEKAGYRILVNENERVEVAGQELVIVGIDDFWEGNPDHQKALEGVDTSREATVALMHIPDYLPKMSGTGVGLVLAGHTHGGQVCIPFFGPPVVPSAYGRRFAMGHVKHDDLQMYVSRGVGQLLWFRFNCRPEIPIVVLRPG